METYKKQKNRYQLCLFLFIKIVDLKSNFKKLHKTILNFLGARMAAICLFQVNLYKPWNDQRYCYEKAPLPALPPCERAGGAMSPSFPAFRRPC